MLKIQFNHGITQSYNDLKVGDIFMVLDGELDGKIFIYTDNNTNTEYYIKNDCVNLQEGCMYHFSLDTPIVILENTKLVVED